MGVSDQVVTGRPAWLERGAMAGQRTLDRKARLAVGAVVAIVLLIVFIALRSLATATTPVTVVAQSDAGDNELIMIGGQSQYLDPSTLGGKIANWLSTGGTRTHAFSIRERNFKPESDEPTAGGSTRLGRVGGIMQSDPNLSARIFVMAYEGTDAADRQRLAQRRAERVRTEIVAKGVDRSRIAVAAQEPLSVSGSSSTEPLTMVLVLSK